MPKREGIGTYDRRITFQKKIFGTDASNQHKPMGWENIANNPTVWANVKEQSGSEVFQADQLVGLTVAEIKTRYRTDLSIENRIVYNGKIYDIQAIIEIGRKEGLSIRCESGGQYKEA